MPSVRKRELFWRGLKDLVCHGGLTKCSGVCVDLTMSVSHCGGCGTVCTGTTPGCCVGECKDFDNDDFNCGGCGLGGPPDNVNVCDENSGYTCTAGVCGINS